MWPHKTMWSKNHVALLVAAPPIVGHHPAKFGGYRHQISRDTILVCHEI